MNTLHPRKKVALFNQANIEKLHSAGFSNQEIAQQLNLVANTVYRRLLSAGLKSNFAIEHHGHAPCGRPSAEYIAWKNMNARCNNINHPDFENYGARGIKVCQRWKNSFAAFLADMGPRPISYERMSLERRNNEEGYSPENCTWSPLRLQSANRRCVYAKLEAVAA